MEYCHKMVLAALVIVGVWNAFNEGMVFDDAGKFLRKRLPKWITFPTFDCPMCMASVWGSIVWFNTGGNVTIEWFFFVVALSGLCKLVAIEWLNRP